MFDTVKVQTIHEGTQTLKAPEGRKLRCAGTMGGALEIKVGPLTLPWRDEAVMAGEVVTIARYESGFWVAWTGDPETYTTR